MARFILKRIAGLIPLLLIVSFLDYALLFIAPGNPAELLAGGRHLSPRIVAAVDRKFGLDKPFLTQYWDWLVHAAQGNFGETIVFHERVSQLIVPRILPTVELAGYALVLVIIIGLAFGALAALKEGSIIGSTASGLMLTASALSPYVAGVLLIAVFAVGLGWFPIIGLGGGGLSRIYHLTLPAIALSSGIVSLLGRTTQASLSEVLREPYVEAARSRGFAERRVIGRHAFRNALLPITTIAGLSFGFLLAGTVLVEYTFGLNGIGALLVQSVLDKDYPTVQALTLLFAATFVVINTVVDIGYAIVDPRVRLTTAVA